MIAAISAIVPTIGRPDSLERLLRSLAAQSVQVSEVIVADGSETQETARIVESWSDGGFPVRRIAVQPPNAVGQRVAAIALSQAEFMLFLDDDVELDPECICELQKGMASATDVVAVVATLSNQIWSLPTRAWRLYMRLVGVPDDDWQGRVVGPLLRFGFKSDVVVPRDMHWLPAGMTLVRRSAYDAAGGFSDFFLHRCTMNEDVDLGLKLRRFGRIVFWPSAKIAHFHAESGRVSPQTAAEDDLFNRYFVLHRTMELSRRRSLWLVMQFFMIETASNLGGAIVKLRFKKSGALLAGRVRGLWRVLLSSRFRDPTRSR
jgi:GT2 family glycosyltransferase